MVANHVRKYRQIRKLTLMELSDLCGVSDRTISDVERGAEPRVVTAIRIARALGTSVEQLWPV